MDTGPFVYAIYAAYAVLAITVTAWLARTLFRNGAVFLDDVFADRPGLAEAVNRLLVVGFAMLNLGYAFAIFRVERYLDGFGLVQYLVNRLAILLVTLALIHFVNVAVFWRIRGRGEQRHMRVPVAPSVTLPAK